MESTSHMENLSNEMDRVVVLIQSYRRGFVEIQKIVPIIVQTLRDRLEMVQNVANLTLPDSLSRFNVEETCSWVKATWGEGDIYKIFVEEAIDGDFCYPEAMMDLGITSSLKKHKWANFCEGMKMIKFDEYVRKAVDLTLTNIITIFTNRQTEHPRITTVHTDSTTYKVIYNYNNYTDL